MGSAGCIRKDTGQAQEILYGLGSAVCGEILHAVVLYGLDAVAEACSQALAMRTVSKEVILNLVHRHLDRGSMLPIEPPSHLTLREQPVADCRRYDRLLKEGPYAAQ